MPASRDSRLPGESGWPASFHTADPIRLAEELARENLALANMIAALEARIPSAEEIAYLRNRKDADDRAAWLWKVIKTHAPWVSSVGSAIVLGIWWLATHNLHVSGKP